jgi:hypothetical protein
MGRELLVREIDCKSFFRTGLHGGCCLYLIGNCSLPWVIPRRGGD